MTPEASGAARATPSGARSLLSRLNAWRALRSVWLEPDPPEFQWRLLRYFAFSRAAVALVLLLFVMVPREHNEAAGLPNSEALLSLTLPYLAMALLILAAAGWWRTRFQFRVRLDVVLDLLFLGLAYATLSRLSASVAMVLLVPVLAAGALTSLLFALFTAAVASIVVLTDPFLQMLNDGVIAPGLASAGLYGLVYMMAASMMYGLSHRQVAQERLTIARERELRLQQLVNRLMVYDMQDGVMLVRADGRVVAANPAAAMLLGVPQSAFVGSGAMLFDLKDVPHLRPLLETLRQWLRRKSRPADGTGDDDAPRILDLLPIAAGGRAGGAMLSARLRLRFILPSLANLRSVYMDSLVSSIGLGLPGEGGEMRPRIPSADAITQGWSADDEAFLRHELHDTVLVHVESWERVAEQAQQEKLASMGRLVASVAHQIRNPLAAISQAAELLDDPGDGQEGGAHMRPESGGVETRLLRIIRDNVRRLDQVVADVLMLSRRPRGERVRVQLAQVLPEVVDRWRAEAVRRAGEATEINPNLVRVAVDLDKPVLFDPAQLQQVVGNMLDNALRYCRRVPGSIQLAAYALDDAHAELVIWNDGPEVPTEQQRSLFEPFFTNDAQGTGLGLYMARELCSANDAQIRYGAIALESLLDRTGALTMEARGTLPRRAFVITLMFDQPAGPIAE
ncbi:MAG: histidine kinase dimerization/phospho-acceptor domain-containing protein [Ralstonia sp.]|jgi:two-component system, NtrC family, sensor histidine kinase PilS|uniref:histidine kinase n=5 Tax=Pseudomonadota TaxID=1224 RepID=A0A2P4REP5_RALPI|nr:MULTISPECIES: ATP-binding protein [Ralstonia]MBA4202080.1 PAS domain-containing sensor histidine kinase [Ralstonia sp.]MBA4232604.1 PAS domain-containing sensor histidine kinase [Ralstonia sp.]MBA4237640.1 PAS domain-containing sensor histidine kinase [Ralstonia sp.]MBA4279921.1 PAS domain-containing sensor histidine kinase [Ralstonia sp.]MBA4297331.1 PAS domain-containing sensor histidine kinase [Ralstonia sp.]